MDQRYHLLKEWLENIRVLVYRGEIEVVVAGRVRHVQMKNWNYWHRYRLLVQRHRESDHTVWSSGIKLIWYHSRMVRFDSVDEEIWKNHVPGANVGAVVEVVVRRWFRRIFSITTRVDSRRKCACRRGKGNNEVYAKTPRSILGTVDWLSHSQFGTIVSKWNGRSSRTMGYELHRAQSTTMAERSDAEEIRQRRQDDV